LEQNNLGKRKKEGKKGRLIEEKRKLGGIKFGGGYPGGGGKKLIQVVGGKRVQEKDVRKAGDLSRRWVNPWEGVTIPDNAVKGRGRTALSAGEMKNKHRRGKL